MIIFSYFFSPHTSIVTVSEENITHIRFHCRPNSLMQSLIKIGVTRSCYTRYTFVSQKSHVRVTIVTRTCNGN